MLDPQMIATMSIKQRQEFAELFQGQIRDAVKEPFQTIWRILKFDMSFWELKCCKATLAGFYGLLYWGLGIGFILSIILH